MTDEELIAKLRRRLGDTPARTAFDGMLRDAGITEEPAETEDAA